MDQIATEGTLAHFSDIPDEIKRVFVCAHDIHPEWHIRMQAGFQKHCDSSISKTINFPNHASPEDVDRIYRMAYDLRCKGVTVYRDGCRSSQPMALAGSEERHREMVQSHTPDNDVPDRKVTSETNLFGERITRVETPPEALEPRELPDITSGIRVRQPTPFGNMHIQITVDPAAGRELEVFAQLGKGGDLATSDLEAICRMISLWLRAGGRLHHVIKQLSGIGSSLQIPTRHGRIMSLGDGLARGLKRYTQARERYGLKALLLGEADEESANEPAADPTVPTNGKNRDAGDITLAAANRQDSTPTRSSLARSAYRLKCPECGGDLDMGEGCIKCHGCGYAQC